MSAVIQFDALGRRVSDARPSATLKIKPADLASMEAPAVKAWARIAQDAAESAPDAEAGYWRTLSAACTLRLKQLAQRAKAVELAAIDPGMSNERLRLPGPRRERQTDPLAVRIWRMRAA